METTTRLRIIAALLVVVIALAGGLFFFMPKATQAVGETPEEEPPKLEYNKQRDAEVSLDPALSFTQTIGGTQKEEIVELFYEDGKIFIFGNTESSDCDFDKSGAFVAVLGRDGNTLRFETFEGRLVDVTLYDGGFVFALQAETPSLVAVNTDGDEIMCTVLETEREEIPVDLLLSQDGYLLVTKLTQSISGFTRLKLNMFNRRLEYVGSVVSGEVYSLEYIDTLDYMGEYILLANAKSSMRNMFCYGTWGKKLAHYPLDFSYTVSSFWVMDDFYFLASSENVTMLINEDSGILPLSDRPKDGRLVGDEKCLYASVGDEFFCIKDDRILFSDNYGPTSIYVDNYIYTASTKGDLVSVRTFHEGNKTFESSFKLKMSDVHILVCEGGIYLAGITNGTLGGDDITLVKVQY